MTDNEDGMGYIPEVDYYLDWTGIVEKLKTAYKNRINTIVIGGKGTGKTVAIQRFAQEMKLPLYSVNLSLRTRESHLVGGIHIENGSTAFKYGAIPLSMMAGGILYLDELNTAEADVLVRLDECLDDRRQLIMKENQNELIKAKDDWWCVASINPLTHIGTKELPQQLLSRFPVRLFADYPDKKTEMAIVRNHVQLEIEQRESLKKIISFANKLRDAGKMELPYAPSIRETITAGKLLHAGVDLGAILDAVYVDVYRIYDEMDVQSERHTCEYIREVGTSIWCMKCYNKIFGGRK